MTATDITQDLSTELGATANRHLWGHFARHGAGITPPIITRGEGVTIWDSKGKSYIDGLSGLFVVQVGHGRKELAEAAAKQAETLAFFPLWSYATPPAIELSERIAGYAPGDLNRVFFTTGGGEAVESAWKLAKNYYKLTGKPGKYKVVSRSIAYHGTPQGALAITGLPVFKAPFEPLTPGGFRVPNTNFYRAPEPYDTDVKAFGRYCADRIAEAIEFEGPDTVAAVFLEPVQNAGGCFPPPPGYFERVREICDEYDVLLVSDEVICAYGRIGSMFACDDFGYVPDIITCAKGLTSGYSPIGAMIASDRLFEPFNDGKTTFAHGYTFGGHPVSSAVALANLDIFEREGINDHVKEMAPAFRATLEQLYDLPIVGDVRGEGFFYGIELVKDKATKETFNDEESERLLRGFLTPAIFEAGLYCRADDRGDPVVQLAPPLISGQKEFDAIYAILRGVLDEAGRLLVAERRLTVETGGAHEDTQAADRSRPLDAAARRPAAGLSVGGSDHRSRARRCARGRGCRRRRADLGRPDRRQGCPHTAGRRCARGGRRGQWSTTRHARRPRRPVVGVPQPRWPAGARPCHRRRRAVGRGGRRTRIAVLLECHRTARRHNLFHRVDQRVHLRALSRTDLRGAQPRQRVSSRSRRNRAHRGTRPVFRERDHRDFGRVCVGVRGDPGASAVQVLADRRQGRNGDAARGQSAGQSGQSVDRRRRPDLVCDGLAAQRGGGVAAQDSADRCAKRCGDCPIGCNRRSSPWSGRSHSTRTVAKRWQACTSNTRRSAW